MDLTAEISSWVSQVMDDSYEGEGALYGVSLTMMPTSATELQPLWGIMIAIPSMILGEKVIANAVMPTPVPDEPSVKAMVRQIMEALLTQRSAMTAQANGSSGVRL
jgi:hypothetical protein